MLVFGREVCLSSEMPAATPHPPEHFLVLAEERLDAEVAKARSAWKLAPGEQLELEDELLLPDHDGEFRPVTDKLVLSSLGMVDAKIHDTLPLDKWELDRNHNRSVHARRSLVTSWSELIVSTFYTDLPRVGGQLVRDGPTDGREMTIHDLWTGALLARTDHLRLGDGRLYAPLAPEDAARRINIFTRTVRMAAALLAETTYLAAKEEHNEAKEGSIKATRRPAARLAAAEAVSV
jgi:hypothetical protein